MAKVYKVSLYIIDNNGEYEDNDELRHDIERSLEQRDMLTAHTQLEDSDEFEWDDNLVINNVSATEEDYEKYFKN